MSRSRRHSLTNRFSLMAGLSTIAMMLVIIGLALGIFVHRFDKHMEEHSRGSIQFLQESLQVPLWSLDLEAVRAIGKALSQDEMIGLVEISTPQGDILYRFAKDEALLLERNGRVVHSGQTIGHVRLGASATLRTRTIWVVVLTGTGVGALIIVLQYLLQKLLWRPLLRKPFADLDRMVTAYAEGDFSPAPPVDAPSEFEPLFGILQEMGRTIDLQMEDLKDSQERLALALEGANDGLWDWNVSSGAAHFSPRYYTMIGYSPEDFEGSHQAWRDLLHPDDRPRVESLLARSLNESEDYETEFRMRNKSGQWSWILSRGRVVERDDQGRPMRMAGTHVDITERKLAEGALRESETLIRALMNQTQQFLGLMDTEGRIIMLNKTVQQFIGVPNEHLQGRLFWDCPWWPDPELAKDICAEGMKVALSGGVFRREVDQVDAEGMRHFVDMTLSPFTDDTGRVVYIIPEGRDITDFVQTREAVRESEGRFRTIFEKAPYAITITDQAEGRLMDVNQAFLHSHGITREESRGMLVRDFSGLSKAEDEAIRLEIASKGGISGREFQFRRRDGSVLDIIYSAVPFTYGGEPCILAMTVDVTEQKRAVAALRESEQRYRLLIENSPMPIHIYELRGDDLIITTANRAVADKFPLAGEITGRSLEQAFPILKDSIYMERYRELARGGAPWTFEYVREDGPDIVYAFNITAFNISPGRMAVFFVDIKDQKLALREMRQSEEKFSTLFRLSPDSIMLIDLETGTIADVNETFLALAGRTREETLGRTTAELDLYADPSHRQVVIDTIRNEGMFDNMEIEFKGEHGSTKVHSVSGRTIPLGGKPYLMTMSRDITDIKQMQEMMVQTEKMISVGGIAAGIAHEINNPLGIVLQAAQNLVQRTRPDFAKNLEAAEGIGLDMELMARYMRARKLDVFIEDIRAAAMRAASIIRHLLDFSRRSESKRTVCDLPAIVHKALALARNDYDLKKNYDFKRIRVDLEMEDELPTINCTETEIEQVLLNLLRNAAQAMAEADPPVKEPRIGVRLSQLPRGVRIEVEDNGPGMHPETRRRAFEPFFTTKAPGIGTGLGLSVSYFIITKGHGGRMRVESRPGKGTRFTIELPAKEALQ